MKGGVPRTVPVTSHSDRARHSPSGGDLRLGQPCGSVVAAVEHDGCLRLHGYPGRAPAKYGMPKIFNTNQGSQFASTAFTAVRLAAGNAISIEGRGQYERLCALRRAVPTR